ncbi:MAG: class I SAM-dependent methyltransferase [Desertimonas sp.]
MRLRSQLIPWKVAGRLTERERDTDRVVRETGWVFNNETGETLTLAEFVATGDAEVPVYWEAFGLERPDDDARTLVEIGSGIGRMTCEFTRRYGSVYACDLDGGFLERCREAVSRFGHVDRLQTIEVTDGRSLAVPDRTADVTFSYITLQHCEREDALALVSEAVRVTKPGGRIVLNFRAWGAADPLLLPAGAAIRGLFRVPAVGTWLSRRRWATRLAWQANRLDPVQVLRHLNGQVGDTTVWRNPQRQAAIARADRVASFEVINPNHWWLVATVA